MSRKIELLPRAPVARILYNAGAKRVSADAVEELANTLTDMAEKISEQANKMSKHAGRKTIHEDDIKLAAR
jgi:histone H3/H4